ncbi:MAG: D-2-hydroxyacid dehydrogenase [Gemmatimonadota bacterium]
MTGTGVRRAVLNFRDVRPVWAIPEGAVAAVRTAFGTGWEVVCVDAPADGRGDGGAAAPEVVEAVCGAEVYLGFGLPREVLRAALSGPDARLRWAHTGTAGVGSLLHPELAEHGVTLTNSAGTMGPPMAESALAMMLHFARGLDVAVRAQADGRWSADAWAAGAPARELSGATLVVVALGGVGRELAVRARALGMRVLAVRRSGTDGPEGVEVHAGEGALGQVLPHADYLALTLPGTVETRGLIGAAELAALPAGAVVVNVGRGEVLDEGALVQALRSGRLRGAGLDVFATEPLPASSPLWELPNVLLTPHVSATSQRFWERETRLIVENVGRYLGGEALVNEVELARGY